MATGRSKSQAALLGLAILGSVWALLMPLVVFLPAYEPSEALESARTNAVEAGRLGETLGVLGPVAGLGLLALAGSYLVLKSWAPGRGLLGVSAAALLVLSMFSASSFGAFLLPAAFVLVFPALWLEGRR